MVAIALMAVSCAGSPKRPAASAGRMKDSAPEKIAAQRAAAPHGVPVEQDDERWGFEAARERRRENDARKAQKQSAAGDAAVDVTTPGR
jgi:hypothetical protein